MFYSSLGNSTAHITIGLNYCGGRISDNNNNIVNYGVQGKAGCRAKGPGRAFRGFDLHRRILKVDEASESNNENDVHKVFEHHFILSHLPPVLV